MRFVIYDTSYTLFRNKKFVIHEMTYIKKLQNLPYFLKMKWNYKWIFVFQNLANFWSIWHGHFIKHKTLISEGCTNTSPLILKLEDDNTTKLHDYTVLLVDFVGSVGPKIVGKYVRRPCLVLAVFSLIFHRSNYFRIIAAQRT